MFMLWKSEADLKQILNKESKYAKERNEALRDPAVGQNDVIQIKTTKPLDLSSKKELLARLKKYDVDPVWLQNMRTDKMEQLFEKQN